MNPFISIDTQNPINKDDIAVTLDGLSVNFVCRDGGIDIVANSTFGLHKLAITNKSNNRITITNVSIYGCNLRKLLYLSWIEDKTGSKFQPATELWESDQTWILPFGAPLSYWIETVERKLPNGVFGQNLFNLYNIYYPDSITLDSSVPQVIQDFFQYNFDFTVIPKSNIDLCNVPYMKYIKPIPQKLIDDAAAELTNSLDYLISLAGSYDQFSDNVSEFKQDSASTWKRLWLFRPTTGDFTQQTINSTEKLPAVQKLLDNLDLKIWKAFIGIMPPGGILYPHIDYVDYKNIKHKPFEGCTQLYLPIVWPENNYIKFAGAGTVSKSDGPVVINNTHFTHAVVNASNDYRFVIGIGCDQTILKDCKLLG